MPELDSEAVSFRVASESLAAVRRLERRDMETLHLAIRYQERKVPSADGILLFGDDRLRSFPEVWIQDGRLDGTDRSAIADDDEFKGRTNN